MIRLALGLVPALVVFATAADPRPAAEPTWRKLFNGRDLTGWTPKIRYHKLGENYLDTFRVEDGLLKVRYDQYTEFNETFGHIFYEEPFSHYRLKIEYRFVGEQCPGGPGWATRNSGAMLHCQSPESMTLDQDFPVSAEAQLLGGLGKGKRPTNNLCTPGTNVVYQGKLHTPHCTNSDSETFDGDEWVTAEVEVRGAGKVKHFVNGKLVLEYEQVQFDPTDETAKKLIKGDTLLIDRGYISLQSESHPCDFRRVEIQVLEP